MKAFVVLSALVAAAVAESDPGLLVNAYGAGLPLAGTYAAGLPVAIGARPLVAPVVTATGYAGFDGVGRPAIKAARCTNKAGEAVACADGFPTEVHNTVAYTAGAHLLAKREAEAEADPSLITAYGGVYAPGIYGYTAAYPYTYGVAPAAIPAIPGGYAAAGRYVAKSGQTVHVAKREAEPEADPALITAYGGVYAPGVYGYAAGLPYVAPGAKVATPFGITHPSNVGLCLNNVGLRVPC